MVAAAWSAPPTVDKRCVARSNVVDAAVYVSCGVEQGAVMTRSGFLKWLLGIFGAISLAGIVYPVLRFLKPPAALSGAIGQVANVGPLSGFAAGQLTTVAVNDQPAAVQNLDGKYTVYSLICTHLGSVV